MNERINPYKYVLTICCFVQRLKAFAAAHYADAPFEYTPAADITYLRYGRRARKTAQTLRQTKYG